MGTQENQSEVARFLAQWDTEVEAMQQALEGYAVTARHDFISRRIQAFGDAKMGELMALIAQQQAQNASPSSDTPR